eukprot:CAMPEP_0175536322 /NCGR_PEP_ID=MMETSP0096-20121207/24651_1 /TAXON_ID=311494 /ORGANISM="Alexandrium monilatum, Strain CCMP3105" /LENGTH=179 /DNA_ID=CAMNT_0016839139 /DNA_START=233 /DNA_END=770 /DNA_ORIENTATION=-
MTCGLPLAALTVDLEEVQGPAFMAKLPEENRHQSGRRRANLAYVVVHEARRGNSGVCRPVLHVERVDLARGGDLPMHGRLKVVHPAASDGVDQAGAARRHRGSDLVRVAHPLPPLALQPDPQLSVAGEGAACAGAARAPPARRRSPRSRASPVRSGLPVSTRRPVPALGSRGRPTHTAS